MKKIILINLLFFVFFLILCEVSSVFLAYRELSKNERLDGILKRYKEGNVVEAIYKIYTQQPFLSYENSKNKLRPIEGKDFSKRPVILFGCSVTYGNLLADNENFSAILSKASKRPVYNMAYDGWGPTHMLKLLQEDRRLLLLKEPEYIVYIYIKDHKRRIVSYQGWPYSSQLYKIFNYKKNTDKLIEVPRKYPQYWRLFFVKHLQCLQERIILRNEKFVDAFLFKIFKESVLIIKKRYPNAKLVMLLYDVKICLNKKNNTISKSTDILTQNEIETFKNMGFEIYNIEEISEKSFCGDEYHAHCPIYGDVDYNHPSTKMWEEFVPKLVEKLGI